MQLRNHCLGDGEVRKSKKETEDDPGLTTRLIMSMATEMAETERATKRACIIFQALALAAGVNVANAFAE